MSDPPKKLNLEFILNKDKDKGHSSDDDRSRRNSGSNHAPSSGSHRDDPSGSSHRRDRSQRQPRSGGTSSTSSVPILPRSTPTPAGSSSAHMRMQLERTYRCNICARTFAEKGNLNKHISSVHLKEKSKVCPEPGCRKSFAFRDGLARHIAHVHKNQRPHVCGLCGKQFKQASHLSKHMKTIHKKQQ